MTRWTPTIRPTPHTGETSVSCSPRVVPRVPLTKNAPRPPLPRVPVWVAFVYVRRISLATHAKRLSRVLPMMQYAGHMEHARRRVVCVMNTGWVSTARRCSHAQRLGVVRMAHARPLVVFVLPVGVATSVHVTMHAAVLTKGRAPIPVVYATPGIAIRGVAQRPPARRRAVVEMANAHPLDVCVTRHGVGPYAVSRQRRALCV